MQTKNINVSDRVENQLPEFIRQEDRQLVNFLFEYYKSQEKTGRPYDILNNLLNYLNLDSYTSKTLSSSTLLLDDISTIDTKIEIEKTVMKRFNIITVLLSDKFNSVFKKAKIKS